MNVRNLIPQHKSDFERSDKLKKLDKESIRPIIPELLVWLQDGNWPVALEVREILLPFNNELVPHIEDILRSNDSDWKYFLLTGLVKGLPNETILELRQALTDLVHNPNVIDRASEVDEVAKEILDMIN